MSIVSRLPHGQTVLITYSSRYPRDDSVEAVPARARWFGERRQQTRGRFLGCWSEMSIGG